MPAEAKQPKEAPPKPPAPAEPAAPAPNEDNIGKTGKFKPDSGERANQNGYYTRRYLGRPLNLKPGDDIAVKIRQRDNP